MFPFHNTIACRFEPATAGVVNGRFEVACGVGGVYPSSVAWPTCKVEIPYDIG